MNVNNKSGRPPFPNIVGEQTDSDHPFKHQTPFAPFEEHWDPASEREFSTENEVPSLGASTSEQKTYKNLFVSRLPQRMQHHELAALFAPFGPKSATIMTDAKTGKSKGFGFVLFDSEEVGRVAHQAMNRKKVTVGGLTIALRTLPSKHSADKEIEVSPVLYVRNIPKYVNKEEVERMLESLGSVVFCAMREEPDGLPVWVVLVEYDCQQCADNALSHLRHNTTLYPRQRPPVIAKYAKPMDRRKHVPKPNAVPCPFRKTAAIASNMPQPISIAPQGRSPPPQPLAPPSYTAATANPVVPDPYYYANGVPNATSVFSATNIELYAPPPIHHLQDTSAPPTIIRPFSVGSFSGTQHYAQQTSISGHGVVMAEQMSGGVGTFTTASFAPYSQLSVVTTVTGVGSSAHPFASSSGSQTTTTKVSSDPLQNSSNTTRTAATVASTISVPSHPIPLDDPGLGPSPLTTKATPGSLSPATPLSTKMVAHLPAPTTNPEKRTKHLSRANHAKLLKGLESVPQDIAMPIIGFVPHTAARTSTANSGSNRKSGSFTDDEEKEANSIAATVNTAGTNLTSSLQHGTSSQNTGVPPQVPIPTARAPPTIGAPPTHYSQIVQQGSVYSFLTAPASRSEWRPLESPMHLVHNHPSTHIGAAGHNIPQQPFILQENPSHHPMPLSYHPYQPLYTVQPQVPQQPPGDRHGLYFAPNMQQGNQFPNAYPPHYRGGAN